MQVSTWRSVLRSRLGLALLKVKKINARPKLVPIKLIGVERGLLQYEDKYYYLPALAMPSTPRRS